MLLFIYSQLIRIALPIILLRLWWRGRYAPARRKNWLHRLGIVPKMSGPVIWVHSVSVGETIAAAPIVKRLLAQNPDVAILMTTMTDTGLAQARKMFGDKVAYAYAPYDTPGAIRRFLDRIRPRTLVILETEIWPNMIGQCRRRNVRVLLVNARLSERSAQGYQRVKYLVAPIMQSINWVAAQAEPDAERFRRIGVPATSIEVTGSVKFDVDIPEEVRNASARLRQQFGQRPVWIAGSTHDGEDAQLLDAMSGVLKNHPSALLILVPRHPERFDAVAEMAVRMGFRLVRHSSGQNPEGAQIYLGDTMGDLMMLYGASDVAFVGGSLVKRGGHNPLEPAAWGIPVLSGPYVFNFETIYEQLEYRHGAQTVQSGQELMQAVSHQMSAPKERLAFGQRALAVVESNRGALDYVVAGISRRI